MVGAPPIDPSLDYLGCLTFEYTVQISHNVIFTSVVEGRLTYTGSGTKLTTFIVVST